MGAPAVAGQRARRSTSASATWTRAIEVLKNFQFEEQRGATLIVKEPIGVCGLITPWNWPMNQIAVQGVPGAGDRLHHGAQAVRGRAVLRADLRRDHATPQAFRPACSTWSTATAPASASALSSHPDIDMVSFTGSTRAGIEVAKNAAPTVKRVTQELGGKSPNIVLDDDGVRRRTSRRAWRR